MIKKGALDWHFYIIDNIIDIIIVFISGTTRNQIRFYVCTISCTGGIVPVNPVRIFLKKSGIFKCIRDMKKLYLLLFLLATKKNGKD